MEPTESNPSGYHPERRRRVEGRLAWTGQDVKLAASTVELQPPGVAEVEWATRSFKGQ